MMWKWLTALCNLWSVKLCIIQAPNESKYSNCTVNPLRCAHHHQSCLIYWLYQGKTSSTMHVIQCSIRISPRYFINPEQTWLTWIARYVAKIQLHCMLYKFADAVLTSIVFLSHWLWLMVRTLKYEIYPLTKPLCFNVC